jgi:hypothetical protein
LKGAADVAVDGEIHFAVAVEVAGDNDAGVGGGGGAGRGGEGAVALPSRMVMGPALKPPGCPGVGTARSGMPSPLKSATAMLVGSWPVVGLLAELVRLMVGRTGSERSLMEHEAVVAEVEQRYCAGRQEGATGGRDRRLHQIACLVGRRVEVSVVWVGLEAVTVRVWTLEVLEA